MAFKNPFKNLASDFYGRDEEEEDEEEKKRVKTSFDNPFDDLASEFKRAQVKTEEQREQVKTETKETLIDKMDKGFTDFTKDFAGFRKDVGITKRAIERGLATTREDDIWVEKTTKDWVNKSVEIGTPVIEKIKELGTGFADWIKNDPEGGTWIERKKEETKKRREETRDEMISQIEDGNAPEDVKQKQIATVNDLADYTRENPPEKQAYESYKEVTDVTVDIANTETSKNAMRYIGSKSENFTFKLAARIESALSSGERTYEDAFGAYMADAGNPDNGFFKRYYYSLGSAAPQSFLGIGLSYGVTAITKSPAAGLAVSSIYFGAISGSEQLEKHGEIKHIENIIIDTAGDQLLGRFLLKMSGSSLIKGHFLKAMNVEGETEVGQAIAKLAVEYAKATTDEERLAIMAEFKNYVDNDALLEYLVGATTGGIADIAVTSVTGKAEVPLRPLNEVMSDARKKEEKEAVERETEKKTAIEIQKELDIAIEKEREEAGGVITGEIEETGEVEETVEKILEDETTEKIKEPAKKTSESDIKAELQKIRKIMEDLDKDSRKYMTTRDIMKKIEETTSDPKLQKIIDTYRESQKSIEESGEIDDLLSLDESTLESINEYLKESEGPAEKAGRIENDYTRFVDNKKTIRTAKDLAYDLIDSYVLRGDTFDSLRSSQLSSSSMDYDVGIGGYVNGKKISSDKVVVKTLDGKDIAPKIFSLKELYNDILDSKKEKETGKKEKETDREEKELTQKEKVSEAIREEPKTIKEISEETKILEPNIRRILGVGAKEGVFTRIEKGVYILSKDGQDIAYINPGDAFEVLPELVKDGFKADMIFLDIPYKTPAVTGGNRGVKYELITVDQFKDVAIAVADIARTEDSPVVYMYSKAESGKEAMQKYNDVMTDYVGFVPIAKGEYTKLQKDGVTRVRNMRGDIIRPEGIIVFNRSGKLDPNIKDLNFKLIRPRGYQTEKPAEMLKAIVEMTTEEGEMVLDPFAGSGVTIEQAVKAGRKGYAIEKDKKAVEEHIKPKIEKALGIVFDKDEKGRDIIKELEKDELEAAGIDVEAVGYGESASVLFIDGKPALGFSFEEEGLAGLSVAKDFRRQGVAKKFLSGLLKEEKGFSVIDANEDMLRVLESIGEVSEKDGAGIVKVTSREVVEVEGEKPTVITTKDKQFLPLIHIAQNTDSLVEYTEQASKMLSEKPVLNRDVNQFALQLREENPEADFTLALAKIYHDNKLDRGLTKEEIADMKKLKKEKEVMDKEIAEIEKDEVRVAAGKELAKRIKTEETAEILRGTKGMTADDIMKTHPNIKLKRDVPAKDIHGNKVEIPKGETLTPYELKGNKILLQDGETYLVSKNQFANIKGQSVGGEAKPFAPELKGTEETMRGGESLKDRIDSLLADEAGQGMTREQAKEFILQDAESEVATRYEQYQLPGGKNYKEILIRAPEAKPKIEKIVWEGSGDYYTAKTSQRTYHISPKNNKGQYSLSSSDGEVKTFTDSLEEAKLIVSEFEPDIVKEKLTFKSPHWDEPNVLAWLRMNERTYRGKIVSFLEELQSDWAAKGRERGFIGQKEETTHQFGVSIGGTEPNIFFNTKEEALRRIETIKNDFPSETLTIKEVDRVAREGYKKDGVPSHPLLKNWQELTIKRALQEAVNNKSDYFAWITGEQTSARYNLDTHIDNIKWHKPKKSVVESWGKKFEQGQKRISIMPKRGSPGIYISINKAGKVIGGKRGWNGKQLDEVLGKGLADKIMAKKTGDLSGKGLKFGGEWAVNLYDKQVKNIVEKLTGGKVELLDMGLLVEKSKQIWKTLEGGGVSKDVVKIKDLKIGLEITTKNRDKYIITDVIGKGKFKAVQTYNLSSIRRKGLDTEVFEKMTNQEKIKNLEFVDSEQFDISIKKTTQQGIKLTPEIKAKIKGEAPEIKVSGEQFQVEADSRTAEARKSKSVEEFVGERLYALNKQVKGGDGFYKREDIPIDKLYKIKNEIIDKLGVPTGKVHRFPGSKIGIEYKIGNNLFHKFGYGYDMADDINKKIVERIKPKFEKIKDKYGIPDNIDLDFAGNWDKGKHKSIIIKPNDISENSKFVAEVEDLIKKQKDLLTYNDIDNAEKISTITKELKSGIAPFSKNDEILLNNILAIKTKSQLKAVLNKAKLLEAKRELEFKAKVLKDQEVSKEVYLTALNEDLKYGTSEQKREAKLTIKELKESGYTPETFYDTFVSKISPEAKRGIFLEVVEEKKFKEFLTKEEFSEGKGLRAIEEKGFEAKQGLTYKLSKEEMLSIGPEAQEALIENKFLNRKKEIVLLGKIEHLKLPKTLENKLKKLGDQTRELFKKGKFKVEETKTGYKVVVDNGIFQEFTLTEKPEKYPIPLFPKSKIKELLKADPEFAKNPVLTVTADDEIKFLTYTGDKTTFSIVASAMGLDEGKLGVGDEITLDVDTFLKTGRTQEIRAIKYEGKETGSIYASVGKFAKGTPIKKGKLFKSFTIKEGKSKYYEKTRKKRRGDLHSNEIFQSPLEIKYKKDGHVVFARKKISSPADVAFAFRKLKKEAVEKFYVVGLKNKKVVSVEPVSVGTLDAALIHPRETTGLLLRKEADEVYYIHNHPSGNIDPSNADIVISHRLADVHKEMGIKYSGHIIIDTNKFGFIDENYKVTEERHHLSVKDSKKIDLYHKYAAWVNDKRGGRPVLGKGKDVYELIKGLSLDKKKNSLVFYLNTRNEVIFTEAVSKNMLKFKNIFDNVTKYNISGILIGNFDYVSNHKNLKILYDIRRKLNKAGIELIDVVEINKTKQTDMKKFSSISKDIPHVLGEKIAEYEELTVKESKAKEEVKREVKEEANIGTFSDGTPIKTSNLKEILPIRFPDLIHLTRQLGSSVSINRRLKTAYGRFMPAFGTIELHKDIFSDTEEASKTLAHEIGHLTDWLPDKAMDRGNVLGRVLSLRKFMKWTYGKTKVNDRVLRDELWELSIYWRPMPPIVSPNFMKYRKGSDELYADAISVLLNSPGLLEKKAPNFYKSFFENLDKKPKVLKEFFTLQGELRSGSEETIERWRGRAGKMFESGNYKAIELQEIQKEEDKKDKSAGYNWMRTKRGVFSLHADYEAKVKEIKKKGGVVNDNDNPVYYLNERNYVGSKIKTTIERHLLPPLEEINKHGITKDEMAEMLMYDRILKGDRGEVANPGGFQKEFVEEMLGESVDPKTKELKKNEKSLKEELGAEKFAILKEQAEIFRAGLKKVFEMGYNEGLYNDELYKMMQKNNYYVPFKPVKYMDRKTKASVARKVGTLSDIENPINTSIEKAMAIVRAVENNKAKRAGLLFLRGEFPEEIENARTRYVNNHLEIIDVKEKTAFYMKGGKPVGFYVPKYIADSLNNRTTEEIKVITHTVGRLNRKWFKPVFVGFNTGFHVSNFARDFFRFWKNIPKMSFARTFKLYYKAFPHALRKARAQKDEIVIKMEEEGILGLTLNDYMAGGTEEDVQNEIILRKIGLAQEGKSYFARRNAMKPIAFTLDKIREMGDTIEALPKIAGYIHFKGDEAGAKISMEQKDFIRRYVGSPDFFAQGSWTKNTNDIWLFSNAIIQGVRSDYEIATNPETRSEFWWKTAKTTFIPKMLMAAASMGLMGKLLKEIMDEATEYDKTNYIIIPIGKDENKKAVYFRLPQDETSRFMGGMFWKSQRYLTTGEVESLKDIFGLWGGQLPAFTPALTLPVDLFQFATGKNVYDTYRQRTVLTEDQARASWKYKAKPVATYVWNQAGGNVFLKLYSGEPTDPLTPKERFLRLPIVSNVIGRFFKVTDYGKVEILRREVTDPIRKEVAEKRMEDKKLINEYVGKVREADGYFERRKIERELAEKIIGHKPKGSDEISEAKRIIKKLDIAVIKGQSDETVNSLIYARTNKEKIELLKRYKGTMTEAEFRDLRTLLLKHKIVSREVFNKLNREE